MHLQLVVLANRKIDDLVSVSSTDIGLIWIDNSSRRICRPFLHYPQEEHMTDATLEKPGLTRTHPL